MYKICTRCPVAAGALRHSGFQISVYGADKMMCRNLAPRIYEGYDNIELDSQISLSFRHIRIQKRVALRYYEII